MARRSACQKKPRTVRARRRERSANRFSAATCAWLKTLLRPQVWNLAAFGGQIMRAADCSLLEKVAHHFFDSLCGGPNGPPLRHIKNFVDSAWAFPLDTLLCQPGLDIQNSQSPHRLWITVWIMWKTAAVPQFTSYLQRLDSAYSFAYSLSKAVLFVHLPRRA